MVLQASTKERSQTTTANAPVIVDSYCFHSTPTPKRQKRVTQENDALVHQKNIKYFENCFGETFTVPPKEEKNNTVTVISSFFNQ